MQGDPFTSDHARVRCHLGGQAARLVSLAREAALPTLQGWYGATAAVEFLTYFGQGRGEWRAGFRSQYGFHVRGKGASAELAVVDAIGNRLPDDPQPGKRSWAEERAMR